MNENHTHPRIESGDTLDDETYREYAYRWIMAWDSWAVEIDGELRPIPCDPVPANFHTWFRLLGVDRVIELIDVAMTKRHVPWDQKWRYYCGCVWRTIEQQREVNGPQPRRVTVWDVQP